MPTGEKMTIDERRKYLRIMRERYLLADRQERGGLLDEMVDVTKLDRKTLIRLMKGRLERQPRRKQRGRIYTHEVDDALRVVAESLDHICAERLTPSLPWLAKHLAAHGEMRVSPELLQQLEKISIPTVRRILARVRQDEPRLPRQGPARANQLTRDIPMRRIPWNEQQPGHFEVDLVHHSGPSPSGDYLHTLQMIDVATGWSERRAVLGRSYLVMQDAFGCILARLPFPVRQLHPDNGSEFLNAHLYRFWNEAIEGLILSRSRPFHKNDNRFVEQKNATLVRAYLGHDRLDSVAQTHAVNELYDQMWLFYNFFQPVMRLREKTFVTSEDGTSQVLRRFDDAKTPFDRLCATDAISQERRETLERLREQTNPRLLRQYIHDLIGHIFALPPVVAGVHEDVHDTLTTTLRTRGDGIPVTLSFDRTIPLR